MSYNQTAALRKVFKKAADITGLQLLEDSNTLCGKVNGYNISVSGNPGSIAVIASVRSCGQLPEAGLVSSIAKASKGIRTGKTVDNHLCFYIYAITNRQLIKNIASAVEDLTLKFKENNFVDVCEHCGQPVDSVSVYHDGSSVHHYCSSCHAKAEQIFRQRIIDEEISTVENVPAGVLGAFLGSLLGVLAIILIGMAGRVAAIGGIAMAVGTIMGYKFFAKKISTKGIIISILMMIVMVFFTSHLEWAIDAYLELEEYYGDVSFFAVFINLFNLLAESDLVSDFLFDTGLLYFFTAIGAFPTIRSSLQERKAVKQIMDDSSLAA